MNEKWSRVQNSLIPDGKYEVIEIVKNSAGFRIELDDKVNKIIILFKEDVLSARICDEGDRLKTIDQILSTTDVDFFVKWPLYIIENSRFGEWLESETYEITNRNSFTHFAIVTPNDVIDVLSIHPPTITVSTI